MITIAEIADIHFGASSSMTIKLYENLIKNFINKLKECVPDIIAVCGDLFDQKLALTTDESTYASLFIHKLKETFPNTLIILVQGTKSHDLNQLDSFKGLISDKFRIYTTVTEDYYKGFRFLVIPEEYYPDKSVYDKYFKTSEKYDWCFFHGLFSFAGSYALQTGNKFNKICFTVEDFKDCVLGKVVGGHIHDPIESGNVQYCGSFERWKHGEEKPKGFRIHKYDEKTKKVILDEFIENVDAQKYITIPFSEVDANDLEKLVLTLEEKSKGLTSLRVKIGKGDLITENEIKNLVAACLKFDNVVLLKETKIKPKKNEVEVQKIADERKKRIKEYDGLTFNQITQKYAEEVFGRKISDQQIADVLE